MLMERFRLYLTLSQARIRVAIRSISVGQPSRRSSSSKSSSICLAPVRVHPMMMSMMPPTHLNPLLGSGTKRKSKSKRNEPDSRSGTSQLFPLMGHRPANFITTTRISRKLSTRKLTKSSKIREL